MIRPAEERDLAALRAIERAAGRAFVGLGMDGVAEDEPFSIDELREYQRAGRAAAAPRAERADVGPDGQ